MVMDTQKTHHAVLTSLNSLKPKSLFDNVSLDSGGCSSMTTTSPALSEADGV